MTNKINLINKIASIKRKYAKKQKQCIKKVKLSEERFIEANTFQHQHQLDPPPLQQRQQDQQESRSFIESQFDPKRQNGHQSKPLLQHQSSSDSKPENRLQSRPQSNANTQNETQFQPQYDTNPQHFCHMKTQFNPVPQNSKPQLQLDTQSKLQQNIGPYTKHPTLTNNSLHQNNSHLHSQNLKLASAPNEHSLYHFMDHPFLFPQNIDPSYLPHSPNYNIRT